MKDKLEKYLKVFPEIGKMLENSQLLVIGGTAALNLHGLVTKELQELDIIVYDPDQATLNKIEEMSHGEEEGSPQTVVNGELRRSYKVIRRNLTFDFIIANDDNYEQESVLKVRIGMYNFSVQSIKIILDAKRSYDREKDKEDFLRMIKDNFSYES